MYNRNDMTDFTSVEEKKLLPNLSNEDVIVFSDGVSRLEKELTLKELKVWSVSDPKFIIEKIYQNSLDSRVSAEHVFIFEAPCQSESCFNFIRALRRNPLFDKSIFFAMVEKDQLDKVDRSLFDDVFYYDIEADGLEKAIKFHREIKRSICAEASFLKIERSAGKENKIGKRSYSVAKRVLDIAFSLTALILLSPLFLLLMVLIPLESPGPVFYVSKRAGKGYRVFNFFKFRSMYVDADQRLSELMKEKNLYGENGGNTAFIKLKDDPRITSIGKFIRGTSIDEIPQFFNVLKGDMSLVGNRPLPLYEAKKLTVRGYSERYIAPAGITGLWQISKSKKADMSQEERIALDNEYARTRNFWLDLQIMYKTPMNMFQNEPV